jgi:hypothetical protein
MCFCVVQTNWELWLLEDASRGELPVSQNNDDTLPLGMAIDYTSQQEIHISEWLLLSPLPAFHILLTPFQTGHFLLDGFVILPSLNERTLPYCYQFIQI